MSVAGIAIAGVYILCLIYSIATNETYSFQTYSLYYLIIWTIFVNIGVGILDRNPIFEFELLYVVGMLLTRKVNIRKKVLATAICSLICICISFVHLLLGSKLPNIIPMSERMDDAYYVGLGILSEAKFTSFNISQLIYYVLFVFIVAVSIPPLKAQDRENVLLYIKKAFHVFFIIWATEFVVNNLYSPEFIRNIVYFLFRVTDEARTYYPVFRNGYYGFDGFFTEQSYIGVMVIYYSIIYKNGLTTVKDLIWHFFSIGILLMNGSSTGLMLIPFALVIVLKQYGTAHNILKRRFKYLMFSLGLIVCIAAVAIFYGIQTGLLNTLVETLTTKLLAYITGGSGYSTANQRSAAIRALGNQIARSAFIQCPLFGVGIGTTRAYGVIIGALTCSGIIGIIAHFSFIKTTFSVKISMKNIVLLVIVLLYLYMTLMPWYIYYPTLIPLHLCFSDNDMAGTKEKIQVQNR